MLSAVAFWIKGSPPKYLPRLGTARARGAGFITPARTARTEVENRLADYKPNDEDMEEQDKEEKELEKEEDESEADEPGKYEPLSVVGKKSSPRSPKRRGKSTARRRVGGSRTKGT
jgi:hypothetical protein